MLSEQDDLAWVSKLELSSEHREDVLSAIEDDALWRRFPLHETTTGELIPISGRRAYLDGGIPVPSVLAERIVLLERPVTPRLTAAYNSHHVEEWDATTAINESLAHEEPWKCAAVIMECAGQPLTERHGYPHCYAAASATGDPGDAGNDGTSCDADYLAAG